MTDLMTKNQVAVVFGKTSRTIMNWVKEGRLKGHKIGGSWFFKKADVEALREYGNDAAIKGE